MPRKKKHLHADSIEAPKAFCTACVSFPEGYMIHRDSHTSTTSTCRPARLSCGSYILTITPSPKSATHYILLLHHKGKLLGAQSTPFRE